MPTLEEVRDQLSHLDGASKFLGRREIKELPSVLWEDEKLEKMVQGLYGKGQGILVATNKRLIFLDKGMVGNLRMEDFAYDKITSVQFDTGMIMGKITLYVAGNKAEISQIEKKQVRTFCDYVRAKIGSQQHASTIPAPAAATQENDIISQLEKLGILKEKGILTEAEFETKKKELLARL